MLRFGVITSVDMTWKSGTIRDDKGNEFLFTLAECKEQKLPSLHEIVSFRRDTDYKYTPVAIEITPAEI